MILADNHSEDEPVSFLTIAWIEQNLNRVICQDEVRKKLDKIKYEWEAQKLVEMMNQNRLMPGRDFTPHLLDEQREYSKYLNDKDDNIQRKSQGDKGCN